MFNPNQAEIGILMLLGCSWRSCHDSLQRVQALALPWLHACLLASRVWSESILRKSFAHFADIACCSRRSPYRPT